MRRARCAAVLLFLGVALTQGVWAQEYQIRDLGALGSGIKSHAYGINNQVPAQIVGVSYPDETTWRAVLWDPTTETMRDLGTLVGANSSTGLPDSINDAGQVAGYSEAIVKVIDKKEVSTQYRIHAFLWNPATGAMRDLGTLGGTSNDTSYGWGINNWGQVVGYSSLTVKTGRRTTSTYTRAFLWDPATATMQNLGALEPSADSSIAYAINNYGQVVGSSSIGTTQHACLWDLGTRTILDLGTLGSSANLSYATAINDSGQVVGNSKYDGTTNHAFLWDPTRQPPMQDLGALGSFSNMSVARDINSSGQVVGYSGYDSSTRRAYLWDGTTMHDLHELVQWQSEEAVWTLQSAVAINDQGMIVGYGINTAGVTHAYLLTPVPPPTP